MTTKYDLRRTEMKSILFRSIGVSIFLLSLTLFAFADGDMGAGSKTDQPPGGGNAPTINNEIKLDSSRDTNLDYLGWFVSFFSDYLS